MNYIFALIALLIIASVLVWFMILTQMRRILRAGARHAIEKAWQKVKAQGNPTLKLVEADKILDEALRLLGYAGSLGEKLKAAGPRFRDINGVWWAHKLRNRAVHDLTSAPSKEEIERALGIFRTALADLGAKI